MKIRIKATLAQSGTSYVTPEVAGITFVTKCESPADAQHVTALVAKALGLAKEIDGRS